MLVYGRRATDVSGLAWIGAARAAFSPVP